MNDTTLVPARGQVPAAPASDTVRADQMETDLRVLFHRLNNQLGVILAHAELLEARAVDDVSRARAAQVVASVLDAMGTAKEIQRRAETEHSGV
ncbi:MAG: hypothetical protein ACRD26_08800 [Vicinamibacterales bacterium]